MTGAKVLEALAGQPGGPQLLMLAQTGDEVALVGGAVRDLTLGRPPRELDVVIAGDAEPLARELATILGANVTLHGRFGTAVVEWEAGRVDIAQRRAESYPAPGELPDVRLGSTEEDLQRRDFTVNALAVPLAGPRAGELDAAEHALGDLAAGRLRVLHERSFEDDPTRLLRMARYQARLGFEPEPHTANLAAQAIRAGALGTVSRARVGAELRLALGEADAPAALLALDHVGVLAGIAKGLAFDEPLARRALGLLPDDGHVAVLLMAVALLPIATNRHAEPDAALLELLDGLEFPAAERDRTITTALYARSLATTLELPGRPSEQHAAMSSRPIEAVALAGALMPTHPAGASDGAAVARDWIARLRHVRLAITGEDLLAAGVSAGPEIGARLQAALARKLDGELADGREAELDAALTASV